MSHPVPGRTYGENEYESHSPHKDSVRPGGRRHHVSEKVKKFKFHGGKALQAAAKALKKKMK